MPSLQLSYRHDVRGSVAVAVAVAVAAFAVGDATQVDAVVETEVEGTGRPAFCGESQLS